jgi:hypothetical protein
VHIENNFIFLVSNFHRVLILVYSYVLLGISPVSDCVLPTFRNPLSGPSTKARCGVLHIEPLKMFYVPIPGIYRLLMFHLAIAHQHFYKFVRLLKLHNYLIGLKSRSYRSRNINSFRLCSSMLHGLPFTVNSCPTNFHLLWDHSHYVLPLDLNQG